MGEIIKSKSTVLVVEESEYSDEYKSLSARLTEQGEVRVGLQRFFSKNGSKVEGFECLEEHGSVWVSREQARAFAVLLLNVLEGE
jgi:hypothetical protein